MGDEVKTHGKGIDMLEKTEPLNTLNQTFGFNKFKLGQKQVVDTILSGESAVAIFPTGAGKSLCYQLPALFEEGMALVISPLLSLMKDQIDFLKKKHIPAAKLDSGMPIDEYRDTLDMARSGTLKILMISVERFKNERFRNQLHQMNVSLLVVDEAHCISEWGHNFRPDYLKIPTYQKAFGIKKSLLLTATATPKVIDDMCDKFNIQHENVIKTGFYRKNLHLRIAPVEEERKDLLLCAMLKKPPNGSTIVYVTLQHRAETVAQMLADNGFSAAAYHAGMKNEARDQIQHRFMAGQIEIVVATIAFGMGIDKSDIRKVIHFDLPKSIENYSQEIGRAGRDGNTSYCVLMGNKNSVPILENFVYGDTPGVKNIRQVLETIRQTEGTRFNLKIYTLSREVDIRVLPLKTLLVYLEMEKILSPKYTFYEDYHFRYRVPPETIVGAFQGERQQFVKKILAHSTVAKVWCHVDIDQIVIRYGADRKRILTALDYFEGKGWIELKTRSAVEVFEILNFQFDIDATAQRFADLFLDKEEKDVQRLHEMIALFERDQCLAKSLSEYFGETLHEDCGDCSVCLKKSPLTLVSSELPPIENHHFPSLVETFGATVGTPLPVRLTTRFLCGIASPRLSAIRAKQMNGFGRLEAYPYKVVEQWVKSQEQ